MSRTKKILEAASNSGQIAQGIANQIFPGESEPFVAERREICNACEHRDDSGKECAIPLKNVLCCGLCGCVIKVKTTVNSAECPIGKWGAHKEETTWE